MKIQLPQNLTGLIQSADYRKLDDGKIWFGEADKDPRSYPIDTFLDKAMTIPAPPYFWLKMGYVSHNGQAIDVYVADDVESVSILITDVYNRQLMYLNAHSVVPSCDIVLPPPPTDDGKDKLDDDECLCVLPPVAIYVCPKDETKPPPTPPIDPPSQPPILPPTPPISNIWETVNFWSNYSLTTEQWQNYIKNGIKPYDDFVHYKDFFDIYNHFKDDLFNSVRNKVIENFKHYPKGYTDGWRYDSGTHLNFSNWRPDERGYYSNMVKLITEDVYIGDRLKRIKYYATDNEFRLRLSSYYNKLKDENGVLINEHLAKPLSPNRPSYLPRLYESFNPLVYIKELSNDEVFDKENRQQEYEPRTYPQDIVGMSIFCNQSCEIKAIPVMSEPANNVNNYAEMRVYLNTVAGVFSNEYPYFDIYPFST